MFFFYCSRIVSECKQDVLIGKNLMVFGSVSISNSPLPYHPLGTDRFFCSLSALTAAITSFWGALFMGISGAAARRLFFCFRDFKIFRVINGRFDPEVISLFGLTVMVSQGSTTEKAQISPVLSGEPSKGLHIAINNKPDSWLFYFIGC